MKPDAKRQGVNGLIRNGHAYVVGQTFCLEFQIVVFGLFCEHKILKMRSKADKTQKQFGLQTASMSFVSLYFERERNSKEVIYLLARFLTFAGLTINMQPFYSEDVISNSPYCRPCNSCVVSLKNLVLDQLSNSLIGFFSLFSILIACVLEMALILFREILSCHFFMSAKIIPEFLAHYASTQSSPVQFWHTSPV